MITSKRPNLTKPSDLPDMSDAPSIRNPKSKIRNTRTAQALILVLGLMATLTLLGVTFAVVMRVERLSAWNYLDQVRARHYLDTALVQAMEAIDRTMTNYCYPDWRHLPPTNVIEALPSNGIHDDDLVYLFTNNARLSVPLELWPDAAAVTAEWIYIVAISGVTGEVRTTNGRIAFLAVNCSGLIDANIAGGWPRSNSTSVRELDISLLPEITGGMSNFFTARKRHGAYESIAEMTALNPGVSTAESLFVYSYDVGRDVYFTNDLDLGRREIDLYPRFRILDITNYTCFNQITPDAYRNDIDFRTNYWEPLTNLLTRAGLEHPDQVAWNLINYLDDNAIPQTFTNTPYLERGGVEAIPLINELLLNDAGVSTQPVYQVGVELWYPFTPGRAQPADNYTLQVGVFSNDPGGDILTNMMRDWSFQQKVTDVMEFGGTYEYNIFFSPADAYIIFHEPTNPAIYLAIGSTNSQGRTNEVWVLARVVKNDTIVDQAMGARARRIRETLSLSIDDPRLNHESNQWQRYDADAHTMGASNVCCRAWVSNTCQGLPMFHRDDLMQTIGELGNIAYACSNAPTWHNLDLMHYTRGAALPDWMTVRPTNTPCHGLICIGTQQSNTLKTLFHNMTIDYAAGAATNSFDLDPTGVEALIAEIPNWRYTNLRDLFRDETLAALFRGCVPTNAPGHDILKEGVYRNIIDMLTFRQNLFTIVLAAQVVHPVSLRVLAEKRAVAVVYRDAYTGRAFIRSLRYLD